MKKLHEVWGGNNSLFIIELHEEVNCGKYIDYFFAVVVPTLCDSRGVREKKHKCIDDIGRQYDQERYIIAMGVKNTITALVVIISMR